MAAHPYDLLLTIDPDGTPITLPLMLVKPENQPKQYVISEVGSPPPARISEAESSYRDFPVELQKVWAQNDFRQGVGQRVWDSDRPGAYGLSNGFIAASDHKLVVGPDIQTTGTIANNVAPVNFLEFYNGTDTRTYLLQDNDVWRSGTAGITFTSALDPGAVTGLGLFAWGTYILLALSAARYYYSTTGASGGWTQRAAATGDTQDLFIPGKDVVWGFRNPNTLRSSSNPADGGTWSGATTVGDARTDHTVVGGFDLSGVLLIVRTDAIFSVDAAANVTKVVSQFEKDNSITLAASDGASRIYFEAGGEIWEYDVYGGTLRGLEVYKAAPETLIAWNSLDFHDGWVYVTQALGGVLVRGKWFGNDFAWEVVGSVSGSRSAVHGTAAYGAGVRSRIYIYTVGTTVGYADIPSVPEVTLDTTYRTGVSRSVNSSRIDHDFPGETKYYDYAFVDIPDLEGTYECQLRASIDDAALASFGSAITVSGISRVDFPPDTTGRRIVLAALFSQDAASTSVASLAAWGVHAQVRFRFKRVVQATVRVADGLTDRRGGRFPLKASTLRSRLRSARTSTVRVRWADYLGNTFDTVILAPLEERPSRDEAASSVESEIVIRALELGSGS